MVEEGGEGVGKAAWVRYLSSIVIYEHVTTYDQPAYHYDDSFNVIVIFIAETAQNARSQLLNIPHGKKRTRSRRSVAHQIRLDNLRVRLERFPCGSSEEENK